ncbi:hypothetical protein [Ruminococcus flavefaciens]|uniref:hypothetical protein n=1 Tax=Ruminococcus flavefaciens TaxID=1265 RepID=UPI0026EE5C63|nr:hypothetical protein [Ruminococcus flavefaciens]MDD7516830.1 hypothetical protein [Ruminococcus flavefaciens]MDY5692260.1 hypothetical protein [Ruminococcus flavefaciens]
MNVEVNSQNDNHYDLGFYSDGYTLKASADEKTITLAFDNDGGSGTPSLPQIMAEALISDLDEFYDKNDVYISDVEEYEEFGRWNIVNGKTSKKKNTPFDEYKVKGCYSSNMDIIKLIHKLYMNTDIFDNMLIEEEYSHGGGEDYVDPDKLQK